MMIAPRRLARSPWRLHGRAPMNITVKVYDAAQASAQASAQATVQLSFNGQYGNFCEIYIYIYIYI